jgi:hypothetical protein
LRIEKELNVSECDSLKNFEGIDPYSSIKEIDATYSGITSFKGLKHSRVDLLSIIGCELKDFSDFPAQCPEFHMSLYKGKRSID